jgi:hypothetical protein
MISKPGMAANYGQFKPSKGLAPCAWGGRAEKTTSRRRHSITYKRGVGLTEAAGTRDAGPIDARVHLAARIPATNVCTASAGGDFPITLS